MKTQTASPNTLSELLVYRPTGCYDNSELPQGPVGEFIRPKQNMITFPKPTIVKKGWGYELWAHNDTDYCGKILHFNKDGTSSYHLHVKKHETWYVISGRFSLIFADPKTGRVTEEVLGKGHVIEVPPGCVHQLICIEEGDIAEFSTQHFEDDSYRILGGDSQKPV